MKTNSFPKFKKVHEELIVHETPLEEIRIDSNSVTVELDDIDEKRRKICFRPFQAVRVTTMDCTDLDAVPYTRYLWERMDSSWICSLEKQLLESESTDNFLKKSKHFILDLGDNLLEIIAWNAEIS